MDGDAGDVHQVGVAGDVHQVGVVADVATDSDEGTVGEPCDVEADDGSDTATLVDHDSLQAADGVRGQTESSSASSLGARLTVGRPQIIKVAVTVKGKSQLLELNQAVALDEVCRGVCADHGKRWRAGRYAFTVHEPRLARAPHKYVTELNRHDLRHGAELELTYAPRVFADIVVERLSDKAHREEWSLALQRLAELADDACFVAEFTGRAGAVDLALSCVLQADRKGGGSQRGRGTRHKQELLWALRAVLALVRHGGLRGDEAALPDVANHLAALVRAERVDPAVLEEALRTLSAVSARHAPPWTVSAAQHLSVVDLVPLLWDTDHPAVQTAALELMITLARREARLGPDSVEGRMQVTRTVTSPQVCKTIVQNVLCASVRSDMARQLLALQGLLLRPLGRALRTPADDPPAPDRPPVRPPRVRRKSTVPQQAASLLHSRSWCEGEGQGDRCVSGGQDGARPDRRSLGDAPRAASPSSSIRDSMGSVTSLASTASLASEADQLADDGAAGGAQSMLGKECFEYLATNHPTLAVRAREEEEALRGSLAATGERLVRLLATELSLCGPEDGADADRPTTPYQPLVFMGDMPFFHELFCRGLNLLAKTRREMRAKTQRDQDKVLRVVRRQFREALGAQVSSWDQLDSWLSELPYSAVAALWEKERVCVEQDTVMGSAPVQQLRAHLREGLHQLVKQHRLATLRTGARFLRPGRPRPPQKNKSSSVWAWLAPGDASLQYADCNEDGELLDAPMSLPIAAVTSVIAGRQCTHIRGPRGRKGGVDLALSLLLDPHDCDAASLDLVAPDSATLRLWLDGINFLLGKEHQSKSIKDDLEGLMDMEVRLQLMELEGLSLPAEPPPVPPPPPDYNFATA